MFPNCFHALDSDDLEISAQEEIIAPLGFGCPLNQYQCHSHCLSIKKRGGYCAGALKTTCTCYNWRWLIPEAFWKERNPDYCLIEFNPTLME